ncbi:MAG: MFS transporter, partial [Actinomycetota bacterium]|nr:MFS transporter [Actinomycetota bacterium]
MLVTVPNLVSVAVEPAIFFLGDAWRRRALVLGGGVAFAAALGTAAAAPSLAVLLVAFAVLYPASGAFVSLSQATLMDAAPAERERNMTRWTIAGSVGAVAGLGVLAASLFVGGGWRETFAVFALLALALVVL